MSAEDIIDQSRADSLTGATRSLVCSSFDALSQQEIESCLAALAHSFGIYDEKKRAAFAARIRSLLENAGFPSESFVSREQLISASTLCLTKWIEDACGITVSDLARLRCALFYSGIEASRFLLSASVSATDKKRLVDSLEGRAAIGSPMPVESPLAMPTQRLDSPRLGFSLFLSPSELVSLRAKSQSAE